MTVVKRNIIINSDFLFVISKLSGLFVKKNVFVIQNVNLIPQQRQFLPSKINFQKSMSKTEKLYFLFLLYFK